MPGHKGEAMNISLKELEMWTDEEYCRKAVERNGDALQYVSKSFWSLFKHMITGM